ncbi:MAG TPA: hypothetical protein VGR39_06685 [Candidatus Acidoferrales bacterium]|nr:hypothetical protein [Candidatus Acidoferrales bacterium]
MIAVLVVVTLFASAGWAGWGIGLAIARRRHQRVAALAGLFDVDTAKIDGSVPIRSYFLWPSVVGLFHGRPASVLVRDGVVRISVAGHFVLPFQVRAKHFSKLGIIRGFLGYLPIGLYFMLFIPSMFFPTAFVWKFVAPPVLLSITLISVLRNYGRIGDVEFPKNARVEVLFPGSAPLQFSTDFPPEFHAMINQAEIQTSLLHLVSTRRVDHLRAVVQFRPGAWNSKLEANCFYRKRLLDPVVVEGLLTDLQVLCEQIESLGQANEVPHTAATQPA